MGTYWPGKVSRNQKIVQFPKSKPFIWEFHKERQMKQKFKIKKKKNGIPLVYKVGLFSKKEIKENAVPFATGNLQN